MDFHLRIFCNSLFAQLCFVESHLKAYLNALAWNLKALAIHFGRAIIAPLPQKVSEPVNLQQNRLTRHQVRVQWLKQWAFLH